jgi:prepilin-type N-terminal cleavage/methylation domain-containing protein
MEMSGTLRTNKGFTLVESIIVMLIMVIVLGITGDAFNRIVSQALGITKTAESNIAGIVGLELMRVDLESAGYGVPWSFSQPINYAEATANPGIALNDKDRVYPSDQTQNNVPRAVMSTDNVASADQTVVFAGSDVLTVRSQSIANSAATKRWTYIESAVLPNTNPTPVKHQWTADNLDNANTVVVIQPVANLKPTNQLVVNPATGVWTSTFLNYSATIGKPPVYNDAEKKSDVYIIYGVDDGTLLRMPFNRADFYVRRPAATESGSVGLPQRCNAATGVLFKGVVQQSDGKYRPSEFPLLECVLDMQVVYELRTAGTTMQTDASDIHTLTPSDVRGQVKAIKVYILTHDGGRDRNYTYPNATIGVGPGDGKISGTGRTYDFAANNIPDWQNYRWRVYQIVARPNNLTGNIAH